MEGYKAYKIKGIIGEINETEKMVILHQEANNDPLSLFMVKQYKDIKRKLFKELLAELLLADLKFKDIERFISRLSTYLKKSNETNSATEELKSTLLKVEKLLAV